MISGGTLPRITRTLPTGCLIALTNAAQPSHSSLYIGTSRDELMPALRSLPVGNYLIFYLPIPDGIEVVRVLPGMRDIDAFF